MKKHMRVIMLAIGLTVAAATGAWSVEAQEKHPVLRNSIQQLEGIKDRLQKAPTDFGGHKAAAIESINHAMRELDQAIAFDKK